jgi:hypothetical protein
LTLGLDVHDSFDDLCLWFEEVPVSDVLFHDS